MSPVNEEPIEEEPDPRFARVQAGARDVMGASERMPIRVILLVILIGLCGATSPIPANIIGIVALLLLTLDIAVHRR